MKQDCLDIGLIQAYLDGEAGPAAAREIASHLAECELCAEAIAAADSEYSTVSSALGREIDVMVPSQRLWERISSEIESNGQRKSFFGRLYAAITAVLPVHGLAAAAAAVLVVFFGMVFLIGERQVNPDYSPVVTSPQTKDNTGPLNASVTAPNNDMLAAAADTPAASARNEFVARTNLNDSQLRRIAAQPVVRRNTEASVSRGETFLPGEESYIKTIQGLQQGIGAQNASLSVSGQVSFERDIAVLDASIRKMREVVRRNPNDRAARRILYAAYQDKIDLLSSAAQRQELIASIK
ncbi:MAG: anti-sigma factor family protein [Pyrinomonadaceae bacterium]|jgi:anti-sigma factor RsiW